MDESIEEKIKNAPRSTGVYLMKDRDGHVIYVGKAKDLRSRVRSYFGGADTRFMIPFLISRITDIEFIITETEKESLILENNLIKEHRPRYNVFLRDDKTYFNIRIDLKQPFPRYQLIRRTKSDGAKYFGPYPSGASAKETLRFLQPIFPLRTCRDQEMKSRRRPCLEYEIGRCLAPCVELVDTDKYHRLVKDSISFLEGRERRLLEELRKRMDAAAEELNFEEAAVLRDRVAAIEQTIEKQRIMSASALEQDVFGLYREGGMTQICALFIRQGKLIGKKIFSLIRIDGDSPDILSSLLTQYYDGGAYLPAEVLIPCAVEDAAVIAEWLSDRKGKHVSLAVPQRGQKRALLDIAVKNAEDAFRTGRLSLHEDHGEAAEILFRRLKLRKVPRRIECFDISNIGGQYAVGSMVTFIDGNPWKQGYRRFRIKTVDGADDYGMLYEMLKRRYAGADELPDLILVDGGKGQLGVALSVLKDLSIEGVDAAGLAKADQQAQRIMSPSKRAGNEAVYKAQDRVYLPRKKEPVYLGKWPAALFLLQRARDEAHRFAVSYHHKLKEKSDLLSVLDTIPGIGPAKKKALLDHFGNVEVIKAASPEALQKVTGINQSLAERISGFFLENSGN
jgi:excinuclease ABC subunit C